jgi:phosphohistidine phosphatase
MTLDRAPDYIGQSMIWLIRHGDAEQGSPDADRKLTGKGKRQARNAGAALAALGVNPDACLTSPKVRALETAELACKQLGVEVTIDERLARGTFDPEELATGHGEVVLVGHDPDFSRAVRDLTGARVQMKKGGVAGIDGRELKALLRPKELAQIGTTRGSVGGEAAGGDSQDFRSSAKPT